MITPPGLATFTDTYVWIDQVFLVQELFNWTEEDPRQATSRTDALDGTLRLYSFYFKDQFTLAFPKLSYAQMAQLKQLLQLTGTGIFHTVQYVSPSGTKLYDGSTAAGYGVNTDVNRVRKKVWFDKQPMPHWPNQNGFFAVTLHGMEG